MHPDATISTICGLLYFPIIVLLMLVKGPQRANSELIRLLLYTLSPIRGASSADTKAIFLKRRNRVGEQILHKAGPRPVV